MASRPDSSAQAQLGAPHSIFRFLVWLDFVGDPVRSTTWPANITPSGTGDADLDGFTFEAINPEVVSIGDVQHGEDGSDTLSITLSGLPVINTDLLNIMGDTAKWRGRDARLWMGVANADYAPQGVLWSYYTGTMVGYRIAAQPDGQAIELRIEGYLGVLTPASNRSLMSQTRFDPDDRSAEVALASANGTSGSGAAIAAVSAASGGRSEFNRGINLL